MLRLARLLVAALIFISAIFGSSVTAKPSAPPIPNPVLIFIGSEYYTTGGKNFVRYRYDVFNKDDLANDMFAPAPALPPCGRNTNASRTWIDLFDQRGLRLNGFCAIGTSAQLNGIWFAVEEGTVPPSWIYIELMDRQTNTKFRSNLAETVL